MQQSMILSPKDAPDLSTFNWSLGNTKRVRRVVLGLSSVLHTSIFRRYTPNAHLIRDLRLCNVSLAQCVGALKRSIGKPVACRSSAASQTECRGTDRIFESGKQACRRRCSYLWQWRCLCAGHLAVQMGEYFFDDRLVLDSGD